MTTTTICWTVLMIEDNPAHAFLIETLFRQLSQVKVSFHHATSLSAGLIMQGQIDANVALLDLGLPDAHGVEGLIQFREQWPDVPVVVLTSHIDLDLSQRALDYGAQDYLLKDDLTEQTLLKSVLYAIERHKYMQQLLQNEIEKYQLRQEVESERFFKQLAVDIYHELRTPLTVILSAAEMIKKQPTAEIIESRYNKIKASVNRLVAMGNYMGIIARLSTVDPQSVPPTKHTQLSRLCSELAGNYSRLQYDINGRFSIAIHPDDLYLALDHLIINGLTHSPQDNPVFLSIEPGQGYVELAVSDHGEGLDQEEWGFVFRPFYKVDTSRTTARQAGAGLGLTVVQAITKVYQGEIFIESKIGEGSRFVMRLPRID